MIFRPEYINKIKKYANTPVIKVLTGMRRCGKSTILKQFYNGLIAENINPESIVFINMESLEFDSIRTYSDLYNFVKQKIHGKTGKCYIMIDEVQEISEWEKAIASFLSDDWGDIYITGSNAHLLSSELATLLSGRYIEIPIYPLCFAEFLEFRKFTQSGNLDFEFQKFLKYGGLPGIHSLIDDDEVILSYINSILNTVMFKDVVARNKIRDVALLEKICRYLTDNCGNITSAKSIADYFKSQNIKISIDTVINYISVLEKAFLFYRVSRYDIKGKRYLEVNDKLYLGDHGLRNGLIGHKDSDISAILENIIFLDLKRRDYKVSIGVIGDNEIDFVAEKKNEKLYIQVCYILY
jgi:predicted AAA+ superfamily ATPase